MKKITVEVTVKGDINKVWDFWNNPRDITHWAFASDDWECPYAVNDLVFGGKFLTRMSAKDKSVSFDVTGTYNNVIQKEKIEYTMDDKRTVSIDFLKVGSDSIKIVETFEMEDVNPEEIQRKGWQAILNNFKNYVESKS